MAFNLFVSHSFKDAELVKNLKSALEELGVQPYLAQESPEYGSSLPHKIEKAIDSSNAVLVILTKTASNSASVNQEIGYARRAKKLIIAMVEEGASTGIFLEGLEVIRFTTEKVGDAISKAIDYVRNLVKDNQQEAMGGILIGVVIAVFAFIVIYALSGDRK